jgi:hypothetical protein
MKCLFFDSLCALLDDFMKEVSASRRNSVEVDPAELRVTCKPRDDVGEGFHKHRCECGTTWKHTDDVAYSDCVSHDQFIEAHSCPSCGEKVFDKYGSRFSLLD